MTLTTEAPPRQPVPTTSTRWFDVREIWGTAAIMLMWLAVLFTGVYGGSAMFTGADGSTTQLPAAVFVAFFAFLATAAVARRAFGPGR